MLTFKLSTSQQQNIILILSHQEIAVFLQICICVGILYNFYLDLILGVIL